MRLKLIKTKNYKNDIDYYNWRDREFMDDHANYLCIDEESADEIVGTVNIEEKSFINKNYIHLLEVKYERKGIGSFIVNELLKTRDYLTGISLNSAMPFWESINGIKFDDDDYREYKEGDFYGYVEFKVTR